MKFTKYILFAFLTVLIQFSCNKGKKNDVEQVEFNETVEVPPPPSKYYVNLKSDDCKKQILEAKKHVNQGLLKYQISTENILRYRDEFTLLLAKKGIEYINNGPNCTMEQECYGFYMDSIIQDRFGKDFIYQIEKKADSLFLSKALETFVIYWHCDEQPINKSNRMIHNNEITLEVPFPVKSNKRTWKTKNGDEMWAIDKPFMDISFMINKNGSVSNFELMEFIHVLNANKKFEKQLLEYTINKVKTDYNDWKPGTIHGQLVNTNYTLRVKFEPN